MKKFLTLTVLLALCLTVSANATQTRGMTMGNVNGIIVDDGNIWMFPSTINLYPDQAEAVFSYDNDPNLVNSSDQWGQHLQRVGAHFKFNENSPFVLGIYIVNDDNAEWNYFAGAPFNTSGYSTLRDFTVNTNRSFNIFYGRQMGTNPFGVHLKVNHSSWSNDVNDKESYSKIRANFGLTTNGGSTDWALGLWTQTFTDETAGTPNFEADGNFGASLKVRRFTAPSGPNTWVWHAGIKYDKQGAKDANFEDKVTYFSGMAGIGLNYAPSSTSLAVADFGVRFKNEKFEETDNTAGTTDEETLSSMGVYWKVGMDGQVNNWLDARFGATNEWRSVKDEYTPSTGTGFEDKDNGNRVQAFVGAGLHFGNVTLDTWLDAEWLLYGPSFIGGLDSDDDGGDNPMFGEVSLRYNFGM